MSGLSELWSHTDEEGNSCDLDRHIPDDGKEIDTWQITHTAGRFTGYPYIVFGRDQLINLYRAIEDEINNLPPKEE